VTAIAGATIRSVHARQEQRHDGITIRPSPRVSHRKFTRRRPISEDPREATTSAVGRCEDGSPSRQRQWKAEIPRATVKCYRSRKVATAGGTVHTSQGWIRVQAAPRSFLLTRNPTSFLARALIGTTESLPIAPEAKSDPATEVPHARLDTSCPTSIRWQMAQQRNTIAQLQRH